MVNPRASTRFVRAPGNEVGTWNVATRPDQMISNRDLQLIGDPVLRSDKSRLAPFAAYGLAVPANI